MQAFTPQSIGAPATHEINGKQMQVIAYIEIDDSRFLPLVDVPMMSDYHWHIKCLQSRLAHPEAYEQIENLPEVIERLTRLLTKESPVQQPPTKETLYRAI